MTLMDSSASSLRPAWLLRGLAFGFLVLFFVTACGPISRDERVEEAIDPVVSLTPLPTITPLPTPEPLKIPEATPTPTPEFGPSGRPTIRGESHFLTAKSTIHRPEVYDEPNGNIMTVMFDSVAGAGSTEFAYLTNPTYFGNPLVMLVREGEPGDEWAKVQIPSRPITTGWVNTADYEWGSTNYYVQINVGTNHLIVWDGDDRIVDEQAVVTGKSSTWTPIAATFVDEKMPGPSAAYGPNLMSLGMFSQALDWFGGGLPKVAMHGTNQPGLMGQYASNGCVRMPNDVVSNLASLLPAGTRVDIVNNPDGSTSIADLLTEDDLATGDDPGETDDDAADSGDDLPGFTSGQSLDGAEAAAGNDT